MTISTNGPAVGPRMVQQCRASYEGYKSGGERRSLPSIFLLFIYTVMSPEDTRDFCQFLQYATAPRTVSYGMIHKIIWRPRDPPHRPHVSTELVCGKSTVGNTTPLRSSRHQVPRYGPALRSGSAVDSHRFTERRTHLFHFAVNIHAP